MALQCRPLGNESMLNNRRKVWLKYPFFHEWHYIILSDYYASHTQLENRKVADTKSSLFTDFSQCLWKITTGFVFGIWRFDRWPEVKKHCLRMREFLSENRQKTKVGCLPWEHMKWQNLTHFLFVVCYYGNIVEVYGSYINQSADKSNIADVTRWNGFRNGKMALLRQVSTRDSEDTRFAAPGLNYLHSVTFILFPFTCVTLGKYGNCSSFSNW